MKRTILPLILMLLLPGTSHAHCIWLENSCVPEGKSADQQCISRLYFGEYNEEKREPLSGRLAERKSTEIFALSKENAPQELHLAGGDGDHFAAQFSPDTAHIVAIDDEAEVSDLTKYKIGVVRPIYYARAAAPNAKTKAAPYMNLDLILSGLESGTVKTGAPITFQTFFNLKPLADGAKIEIFGPAGSVLEGQRGSDGQISFVPKSAGLYVIEAIVTEKVPGEFKGKKYEAVRHRASLTLNVIDG